MTGLKCFTTDLQRLSAVCGAVFNFFSLFIQWHNRIVFFMCHMKWLSYLDKGLVA